jgi:hypothetical protein
MSGLLRGVALDRQTAEETSVWGAGQKGMSSSKSLSGPAGPGMPPMSSPTPDG